MNRTLARELLGLVDRALAHESSWVFMSPSVDEFDDFAGRDIDLVADSQEVSRLTASLCEEIHHVGLASRVIRRWEVTQIYVMRRDGDSAQVCNIDVMGHVQWRGWDYASPAGIRCRVRTSGSRMVSADTHEAYRCLREWYWRGGLRRLEGEAAAACKGYPAGVADEIAALSSDVLGDAAGIRLRDTLVTRAEGTGEWPLSVAEARRALVLNTILRHPVRGTFSWLGWRVAAFRSLRKPRGVLVALIGPDGSGKSSVASELVRDRGQGVFSRDRSVVIHWRPGLLPKPSALAGGASTLSEAEINDPHARAPHGLFVSGARILYFFLDYWLGYWLRIRPALARGALVVFDRYAFDMLLDPVRYRLSPRARGLAHLFLFRLVPKPSLTLVLDLPAMIAHERKPDLTVAEIDEYSAACRELANGLEDVVVIDASQPLEQVAGAASQAILMRFFK